MCETDLKRKLHEWFKDEMQGKGIAEYNIEYKSLDAKGTGYTSGIMFIKITGKGASPTPKSFHFVMKRAVENPELRKTVPISRLFETETIFYEQIYPTFRKFQADKSVHDPFSNVPVFLKSLRENGIEYMIFEDLTYSGFQLHPRDVAFNVEHLKVIFSAYARFHAVSFALKDQNPELFERISSGLGNVRNEFIEKTNLMPTIMNILDEAKLLFENQPEIIDKYQEIMKNAPQILIDVDLTDNCNVVTHGDNWTNNFMFKYEKTDKSKHKPIDVRILDWQVATMAPAVFDLSYTLFSASSENILQRTQELLDTYYQSFSDHMKHLGSNPNEIYPREEFMKDWNKHRVFGFLFAVYALKLTLIESDEIPDMEATSGDAFSNILSSRRSPVYEARARAAIRYFTEHCVA